MRGKVTKYAGTEQTSRVSTLTLWQSGLQAFIVQIPGRLPVEELGGQVCYPLFLCSGERHSNTDSQVSQEGKTISDLFINEQIRDREVRLIGEDGAQLGIMSAREALKIAEEAGLDLVKIAPTAKPPVCKIVDYGKYKYEQTRKEKEAKKKQRIIEIKEIRMSPNIDTNDLNTKVSAAKKFIMKGNKVKVTLRFRGREMAHMQTSKHILDDFAQMLSDVAVVEKAPKVEGRTMTMFLTEKR